MIILFYYLTACNKTAKILPLATALKAKVPIYTTSLIMLKALMSAKVGLN